MGRQFHRERDTRSVTAALATIGDGWKLLIVSRLLDNQLTLSALCSAIPGARAADLAQQIKELIADGIVRVDDEGSRWEMYSVTGYGRTLIPALDCMGLWGRKHLMRLE